tara:strand:- start:8635 stop:10287 length:1653 start_codon:yes stop_codon:yes gene_type:complete
MSLKRAALYWHTIRYLRSEQLFGRVKFRLAKPKIDGRPAPALRSAIGPWATPATRTVSMERPASFLLLGERGTLEDDGWDNPERSKLWRYNQHYFDDLNARHSSKRQDWHTSLVTRWIKENPAPKGSGWEPYPLSLRIVNWVKWQRAQNPLSTEALDSLAVQARWLTQRLEWHLLGNHLFVNAKALIMAASLFDGHEAEAWLKIGADIIKREMDVQFLPDGGHFELAPMYHVLAVEDLLDILNALRAVEGTWSTQAHKLTSDIQATCQAHLPAALAWSQVMSHPDDRISFFNDCAFGIAPELSEIKAYANALSITAKPVRMEGLTHLKASGYARLATGPAVLLVDMASIGPDYLPGHAHADTLSFEMSLFNQRLFVNSGTSLYGIGAERLRQRGTAAHNTVTVEGQDSSEVWSGFRVARRARVSNVAVGEKDGVLTASATHNGYKRLSNGPIHARSWTLNTGSLSIKDQLSKLCTAETRYHLHPDVRASEDGTLTLPDGKVVHWDSDGSPARLETSSWHPEFGKEVPNQCLVLPLDVGHGTLHITWAQNH